jgi:hypothetical protein
MRMLQGRSGIVSSDPWLAVLGEGGSARGRSLSTRTPVRRPRSDVPGPKRASAPTSLSVAVIIARTGANDEEPSGKIPRCWQLRRRTRNGRRDLDAGVRRAWRLAGVVDVRRPHPPRPRVCTPGRRYCQTRASSPTRQHVRDSGQDYRRVMTAAIRQGAVPLQRCKPRCHAGGVVMCRLRTAPHRLRADEQ